MKYNLKILTSEKDYSYLVKALSSYRWDTLLGFENTLEDLKKLDNLRKVTDEMIKTGFIDEFYLILNKERKYAQIYKDYLLYLIYHIHFQSFSYVKEFRKSSLVYLESYQSDEGDYIKYDYINDDFTYQKVIKEYER